MKRFLENSTLHVLLLAILCVVAYSNSFHVPLQFDDIQNIVEKPYVRDFRLFLDPSGGSWFASDHGFRMRTVGYFTLALNYWIGGHDVVGYHLGNLLIHCVNGLLVYLLVVLSFRGPVLGESTLREFSKPIALFSSLLFLSHPVQTQAVTYIVQRLTSLAACFYLMSLVSYIQARLAFADRPSWRKASAWYCLSLVSALLAMKTKEIAFTLPLVVALYEFLFFRGDLKKRVLLLTPLLLTMGVIPYALLGAPNPTGDLIGDVSRAMRVDSPLSRWDYFCTELRVLVTYVRLLFFPIGQNLDYDYPVFRSFLDGTIVLSSLFLATLIGTGGYLVRRDRKLGSGASIVSFGIFWFFITLSVESSIIPITDVIFEHRLYLPSVGFWIAVTSALFLAHRRFGGEKYPFLLPAVLSAAVLLLCGMTYARNRVWGTEVSLWEDVVRKSPAKARGYNSLGFALRKEGRVGEAVERYRKAIQLEPDYALAHNNLGFAYYMLRRNDEAIAQYELALRSMPDFAEAHNGLGIVYGEQGNFQRAMEENRIALRLKPDFAQVYTNLGNLYWKQGLIDNAFVQYRMAIRIRPDLAEPYNNLGVLYANMGLLDQALPYFDAAVRMNPGNPDYLQNRNRAAAGLGIR
jgi:protein O-mannosyl-transferase